MKQLGESHKRLTESTRDEGLSTTRIKPKVAWKQGVLLGLFSLICHFGQGRSRRSRITIQGLPQMLEHMPSSSLAASTSTIPGLGTINTITLVPMKPLGLRTVFLLLFGQEAA